TQASLRSAGMLALQQSFRNNRRTIWFHVPCMSGGRCSEDGATVLFDARIFHERPVAGVADHPSRCERAMRSACAPLAAVLAGPLAGCAGVQSAWSPEGPSARAVVTLGNVMFIGAGLILALVIG